MKIIKLALLCTAALLQAQTQLYPIGPDSQPQAGVPAGVLTKYVLQPGRFYPGTPHNYSVYVPSQYDAAKPTAFMIYMDGSGAAGSQHVPVVFDNLIAKRELPPMIGIFIDPGVLPALSDQAMSRYERIFEYDNISGRFAQFLLEELIPEVGRKYNLSKDPDARGLAGTSTGAMAAFVAAWQRPDQFHRVLTFIGTFVDAKGGEELAALVRKTEPRPLRVFLQDGKNDHLVAGMPYGTFYAGSWPINNQVMFEALQFAGYDSKLTYGEGGHDMRQGTAIMPDALRWLWQDYPKPIAVHEPEMTGKPGYDPRGRVYSMVSADKPWEQVGATYKSVASPASDKEGNVFFADPIANRIYKSDTAGKVVVFKENTGGATALHFAPDGRLYASQPASHRIVSYGTTGDERAVAQNVDASDLAVTLQNGIYFTDTAHKAIGFVDSKGGKRVVYSGGEIASPAGLSLTTDQAMLVVTDRQTRYSWSFQIAKDGSLINGEPFYRLYIPDLAPRSDVTGVTLDVQGQVYFATPIGIQVTEQNGRVAAVLNPPEYGSITNIAFAGKDFDWIYAAEGTKLFRRPVKIRGVSAWSPVKPPKPPL
ncbi:MAG: alpha/beta hydrolase-fold protein [Acidobacteriota bacterium]|nr:alpha/beta hydrolase-fold protein [Acidobacteriota bacterium]